MEGTRRRIAILCSHLRPVGQTIHSHLLISRDPSQFLCVSTSRCSSESKIELGSEDSKIEHLRTECVFCRIVCGESTAYKLYEDEQCLCILDTNPLCRGHSLLIPKCHYPSLDATPPSIIAAMCSKIPFISNAIMKATGCDSFNLLINNGAAAGQVIFHTHIHIIPRKAQDCLWASESLRRLSLTLDEKAPQLAECIREKMSFTGATEDSKREGPSLVSN